MVSGGYRLVEENGLSILYVSPSCRENAEGARSSARRLGRRPRVEVHGSGSDLIGALSTVGDAEVYYWSQR
jgi:hypothetical protein